MLITSMDNPKIKEYVKLKQKKYRDITGKFIVEGMHLVLEAYKCGYIEEVILEQDITNINGEYFIGLAVTSFHLKVHQIWLE